MAPERIVALTRQAEEAGFAYGWLFDSHVLWLEPYPLLTLMALNTTRMRLGTCVTNPAVARPHRDRQRCWPRSTVISGGRMDLGIGRGDSSRRVLGKKPTTLARPGGVRSTRIRALARGRADRLRGRADAAGLGAGRRCRSGSPATARRRCSWPGASPTA